MMTGLDDLADDRREIREGMPWAALAPSLDPADVDKRPTFSTDALIVAVIAK